MGEIPVSSRILSIRGPASTVKRVHGKALDAGACPGTAAERRLTLAKSSSACVSARNTVGSGMRGGGFEQNLSNVQAGPTADPAKDHRDIIVGVKTAYYAGQEWDPHEEAVRLWRSFRTALRRQSWLR